MGNESFLQTTVGPFLLRLVLGVIFIYHGVTKINERTDWGASWAAPLLTKDAVAKDVLERLDALPERTEQRSEGVAWTEDQIKRLKDDLRASYNLKRDEVPDALTSYAAQMAVAWGELLGGVAILLGLLTRLSAVGMFIIQVGAILTVTGARGFSFVGGGYEYNLALAAMCLVMALEGGGHFSLDHWWKTRGKAPAPTGATTTPTPAGVI